MQIKTEVSALAKRPLEWTADHWIQRESESVNGLVGIRTTLAEVCRMFLAVVHTVAGTRVRIATVNFELSVAG